MVTTVRQGTWTYSGDPATSDRDAVRFLVQDTNDEDQLLSDEEVDYLLAQHGDVGATAVAACLALATRYAQRAVDSKSVGDLKIEYADRAQAFRDLAKELRRSGALAVRPVPVAMGITESQKEDAAADDDRIPTHVELGNDDFDRPTDDSAWETV